MFFNSFLSHCSVEKDDEKKQKKTAGDEDADIDDMVPETANLGDSSDEEPLVVSNTIFIQIF